MTFKEDSMRAPNLDPETVQIEGHNEPLIKLATWIGKTYGSKLDAPGLVTVRRWARDGLILPKAVKQGRSFYVVPSARYIPRQDPAT